MVQPGDVIENPVTGERITFLRTSAQTGGALAEMDLELSPTAYLAAEHIHLRQEEKFAVVDGRIRVRCRGIRARSRRVRCSARRLTARMGSGRW